MRSSLRRTSKKFGIDQEKAIRDYSKGMKTKLNIAAALSHDAELLLLDEPTSGLDPVVRDEVLDLLYDFMQDENHAILLSSHITSDLDKIADEITFIHKGEVLLSEPRDELLDTCGILRCTADQLDALDPSAVRAKRVGTFGCEALGKTRRRTGELVGRAGQHRTDYAVPDERGESGMKAMLYADWMNLRRSMKAIMIATVVIALASIVSGNGLSFVPAMLCMLSLMVPATLMSSDYAYGWDKLSLSLPVSRRDVVSSKFAISLLVNLTVAALGMICIAGMNAFGGDAMAEDMMGMLACEAVGLALMGIEFVLVLRFGPERGRYFLIAVVWVPIIVLTVVKKASGIQ